MFPRFLGITYSRGEQSENNRNRSLGGKAKCVPLTPTFFRWKEKLQKGKRKAPYGTKTGSESPWRKKNTRLTLGTRLLNSRKI